MVVLVRVVDGILKKGQRIRMMGTDARYEVDRVGVFMPKLAPVDELGPGEIGMLTASIKEVAATRVGDTITDERNPVDEPLPGFRPAIPVVFCGLFPVDAAHFEDLRAAMGRLRLNDASFTYEMETSAALGFGFRCGFLGLLHFEIIQERLSREFNLDLIATAPSVIYKMKLRDGRELEIHNPVDMPDPTQILEMDEPWIEATILTPDEYLGSVLKLCQDRRGAQKELTYVGNRAMVKYDLPLNEVVFDFYDRLKSVSRGYASFDYHLTDYKEADLVKLQMLVNGEPVDALSMLVHRTRAETSGRAMAEKLKELIPPHMFQVPIQAAIGGKIIARETVRAFRKDVTAKCYGGDATRKRKLLGQAEGRQKAHAAIRQGRHSAGSVHRGAEGGCVTVITGSCRRMINVNEISKQILTRLVRQQAYEQERLLAAAVVIVPAACQQLRSLTPARRASSSTRVRRSRSARRWRSFGAHACVACRRGACLVLFVRVPAARRSPRCWCRPTRSFTSANSTAAFSGCRRMQPCEAGRPRCEIS